MTEWLWGNKWIEFNPSIRNRKRRNKKTSISIFNCSHGHILSINYVTHYNAWNNEKLLQYWTGAITRWKKGTRLCGVSGKIEKWNESKKEIIIFSFKRCCPLRAQHIFLHIYTFQIEIPLIISLCVIIVFHQTIFFFVFVSLAPN